MHTIILILQILVACSLLLLGVFVLSHNRKAPLNRVFFLMTISVSLWLLGFAFAYLASSPSEALARFKIAYIGVIYISLSTYAFSVVYAKRSSQMPFIYIGMFGAVIFLALLLTNNPAFLNGLYTYDWGYYPKAGKYYWTFLIYFFPYVFLLGYNLFKWRNETPSALEKQVTSLLVAAFLLAYLGATDFLPTFGISIMPIQPLGFIPIGVWVGLVGYTILQYRIWDVRIAAHKTLYYITLSAIIVLVYTTLFALVANIFQKGLDKEILVFNTILFLVMSFVFSSFKEKTQGFIDAIFYRQKINETEVLQNLTHELTSLVDLSTLMKRVMEVLHKNLGIASVTLLVREDDSEPFFYVLKTTVKGKRARLHVRFSSARAFFNKLVATERDVTAEELLKRPEYTHVRRAGKELFDLYKAEVCTPVIRRNRLLGMLFLGTRRGRREYDLMFRKAILKMSNTLAVALENTKLYQEVKVVSDIKSDILTVVSHQLRTPVTSMRWGLHLIQKGTYGELPEKLIEPFEQIYEANLEAVRMIDRLLDVSRLERGKLPFEPGEFNIVLAIEDAISEMRAIAKNKNIKIIFESLVPSIHIIADQERLRDILEILIDNAIKYSHEGKTVRVKLEKTVFTKEEEYYRDLPKKQAGVKISVSDHGIGISPEDQRKLFGKFFRGKNAQKFDTTGLGIGLAYAKSLIERHKGLIGVKSNVGEGTTVFLYLPT